MELNQNYLPKPQADSRITTSSENRHVGPNQHVDVLKRPHDVSYKVVSQTLNGTLNSKHQHIQIHMHTN